MKPLLSRNTPDFVRNPTNTSLKSSHKFPDQWEVWHSYDDGKTWTMQGMQRKVTPPTAGREAATAQPSTEQMVESGRGRSESSHDDWWLQAQCLRAAIVRHFRGESNDDELYREARKHWQWPSFGDEDFNAAYPREESS